MSDRDAILERRAKFLALAIAGIAAGGCKDTEPQVCLSAQPCLTYWPLPSTTTTSQSTATTTETTSSAASATPSTTTTSTVAVPRKPAPKPKPRPRICLSEPFPSE